MSLLLAPKSFIFLQICWRGLAPYGTPNGFTKVDILPSNKYPLGQKGLTLSECWLQMSDNACQGMLILDADVVIDPVDMEAMWSCMVSDPSAIWLAPARLWPKSTGYPSWVWAHRKFGTGMDEWQASRTDVDTGSFCFTYIPRALIEICMSNGLNRWIYPNVDDNMFRMARQNEIVFRIAKGCAPKHMNY